MSVPILAPGGSTLTARSVVLSLLLGAPAEGLAAREVVGLADRFGVAPATTRVALSRLAGAGEVVARDSVYRLSERHLRRQDAQEEALRPPSHPWDGSWCTVVLTGAGRGAAERAELRRTLTRRRLAELREGVWLRPDNLDRLRLPDVEHVVLSSRPDDEESLVRRLWDLDAWATVAHALLDVARSGAPLPERFEANAAIVRQLRSDPHLPSVLLPADWPGDELRRTYEAFRAELATLSPSSVPQQPNPG